MKLIRIIKNKFELKKLKKEQMYLECSLDNMCEAIACLGDEYMEKEEYEEFSRKYSEVTDRTDELEAFNKKYLGGKYFVLF